jgi:hypothetical protein
MSEHYDGRYEVRVLVHNAGRFETKEGAERWQKELQIMTGWRTHIVDHGSPMTQEKINAEFPDGITAPSRTEQEMRPGGLLDWPESPVLYGLESDLKELEHQFYRDHPLMTDAPGYDSDVCAYKGCVIVPRYIDTKTSKTWCRDHAPTRTDLHRLSDDQLVQVTRSPDF